MKLASKSFFFPPELFKNHYTKTDSKIQIKKRKQKRGECLGLQVNNNNAVNSNTKGSRRYSGEHVCDGVS